MLITMWNKLNYNKYTYEYGNFCMKLLRIWRACFKWSFISDTELYSSSDPMLFLDKLVF